MIKKFNKTSIAILTVIAIFVIFALALTAINIATAIEEEATPEATAATTTEQANDQAPANNPTNEPSLTVTPSKLPCPGTYNIELTISDYGDYNIVDQIIISNVYYSTETKQMVDEPYKITLTGLKFPQADKGYAVNVRIHTSTSQSIYLNSNIDVFDATPKIEVLTNPLCGAGVHTLKCNISDYYNYSKIKKINIISSAGRVHTHDVDINMSADPYLLILDNEYFDYAGSWGIEVTLACNDPYMEKIINAGFNVTEYSPPIINFAINSTLSGQASVGVVNNFHVDLSNLTPDPSYRAYIKVRDPEGEVRYLRDATPISLTSTTASQDFTLMPYVAGNWSIEVSIVNPNGESETEINRSSTTFTATGNPTPPGPTPDPPAPTPIPDPGTGGTITQASNIAQTGDNIAMTLLALSLIAVSCAVITWVVTRKRIVIIKPKH